MFAMTNLAQIHAMLPGSELINISGADAQQLTISKVGSDSRQISAGELFITLSGERFDAHDFLLDVAKAALYSRGSCDRKQWQNDS